MLRLNHRIKIQFPFLLQVKSRSGARKSITAFWFRATQIWFARQFASWVFDTSLQTLSIRVELTGLLWMKEARLPWVRLRGDQAWSWDLTLGRVRGRGLHVLGTQGSTKGSVSSPCGNKTCQRFPSGKFEAGKPIGTERGHRPPFPLALWKIPAHPEGKSSPGGCWGWMGVRRKECQE